MDPILQEIYSTVVPSAPFLIAAYALLWAALLVYVVVMQRGLKNSEKRLDLLEAKRQLPGLKPSWLRRAQLPAAKFALKPKIKFK